MILGHQFAVKLVHSAAKPNSLLVQRGLDEIRAVNALHHPNIVQVFDVGSLGDAVYIVMELLEGMPLSRRLAESGPLGVAPALDIAGQVGAALDAAHSIGVLHRDLTPERLFLVPDAAAPGNERVKVMDFGIATLRRDGAAENQRTQAGCTTDAFPYMSPEQCRSGAVDQRSDIYALGIIAYEMLVGRPPFAAETGVEALLAHLTSPVPPLSQHLPGASATLDSALMRALAKDPAARFATAAQFMTALTSSPAASTTTQVNLRAAVPDKPLYLDENVQFSLYRPRRIVPARWYPMLVFAHLSEARTGQEEQDPQSEVASQAHQILGDGIGAFDDLKVDSSHTLPREGEITFVPVVSGIQFNPPSRAFLWEEAVHREEFRLRADPSLDGKTVRGCLTVFLGSIILADIPLVVSVDSIHQPTAPQNEVAGSHAQPYRQIFASYSHKDVAIVEQFERHVEASALGDRYLRDCRDLRAGEVWQDGLMRLIERADIFQLFWSRNSMSSPFVRQEWEHALGVRRQDFVRPVYWEEPLPCSADGSLPPEALRRLQFHRVAFERLSAPGRTTLLFGAAPLTPPQMHPATAAVVAAPVPSFAVGGQRPTSTAESPAQEEFAAPMRATLCHSRATGDAMEALESEELPRVRARRWPIIAVGGPALAGLAFFLLARGASVGPGTVTDWPSAAQKQPAVEPEQMQPPTKPARADEPAQAAAPTRRHHPLSARPKLPRLAHSAALPDAGPPSDRSGAPPPGEPAAEPEELWMAH